jgi:hypothetical protein
MKSASFISCAVLVLLVAGLVGAQTRGSAPQKLTADVPFDFMVRQVMFPAGNYVVTQTGVRTFYLHGDHGRESASISVKPMQTASHPHTASLIFTNENEHFHLRELWMNSSTGGEVPEPPTEQLRNAFVSRVEVSANCENCE